MIVSTVGAACQIDLVDEAGDHTVVRRSGMDWSTPPAIEESAPAAVIRDRQPRIVAATSTSTVQWMIVPLIAERRTLGALSVAVDRPSLALNTADLDHLRRIGAAVAAALTKVDADERMLRISRTLQESLLPTALPTSEWFELAGRYVAGGPGLDIGGDWYDAQMLEEGVLALSVGDLAGHGVEAAARMGELRTATAALRLVRSGPDALISVLHRLVTELGYFATAICARLDMAGTLLWASAGHLPPLLMHPNGEVELLTSEQSPPLGVAFRQKVPINRRRLDRGDLVLFYTDGLIERRDESIDVSLKRLVETVVSAPRRRPADLIAHVVEQHHGLDPTQSTGDDVAVLAATFT
jgi:serine phosphatase RsbU (regulator of sigma subunit)